jgi:transposase
MKAFTTSQPSYQDLLELVTKQQAIIEHQQIIIKQQQAVIRELQATNEAQRLKIHQLEALVEKQNARISELERRLYGKSSEKSKDKDKSSKSGKSGQGSPRSGFNDDGDAPPGTYPAHLPREDVFEDNLPEGANREEYEKVGTVTKERLAVYPAQLYVMVIHKTTYKRKSDGSFPPFEGQHPFGRCSADMSFVIFAILQKVLFHVPFYRLEKLLELQGITCYRPNMVRWSNQFAKLVEPVVNAILAEIKVARVVHGDESPSLVRCKQSEKSKAYRDTYFWNLVAPDVGIIFKWTKNRNNSNAEDILEGIKGTFVSDALGIYKHATQKHSLAWQICWVHIRRNFLKVTDNRSIAEQGLDQVNLILRIDKAIRRRTKAQHLYPKRVHYRQRFLLPLIANMKKWIADHKDLPAVQTDDQLTKGINYIESKWEQATCFITNPYVLPHNNISEQFFRYLKLGAKNWQFCASELGAKTLCTLYSLVYSAKLTGINPFYYLADLVEQVHVPGIKAQDLTPSRWKQNREHLVVPDYLRNLQKRQ